MRLSLLIFLYIYLLALLLTVFPAVLFFAPFFVVVLLFEVLGPLEALSATGVVAAVLDTVGLLRVVRILLIFQNDEDLLPFFDKSCL